MTEFRIFGTRYETVNKLTGVSLGSDQALRNRVVAGNTIKVSFQSNEPINNVSAMIQGEPATITTTDNLNWTATLLVKPTTTTGPVKFLVNYKTADGTDAEPILFPTDSSTLFIADQKDYIGNLFDIATVTDSNGRRPIPDGSARRLRTAPRRRPAAISTGRRGRRWSRRCRTRTVRARRPGRRCACLAGLRRR
ncbi:hypothetical protein GCM10025794_14000 [Massilia kyonggiensis]